MIVAIQPAYGDTRTRHHFAASLDNSVPFAEDPYRQLLSRRQLSALTELHPDGRAHFWGSTRSQASKISQLQRGDLVLLTGQLHIRGVGEVAAVLDNVDFASTIWEPHPRRCSFEMVYSFAWFRRVEVPYATLQAAIGTSERDNFQSLRLLRDQERVNAARDLLDQGALSDAEVGRRPSALVPQRRTIRLSCYGSVGWEGRPARAGDTDPGVRHVPLHFRARVF